MKTQLVQEVEDWPAVAAAILAELTPQPHKATVIALSGDLGVGKTTFVQHLAQALGITEPVTSPTFTIMKQYDTDDQSFTSLIHMDAYRLESVAELAALRFDELVAREKTLFCIEWAEKITPALPTDTVHFQLGINQENIHTIQKLS